MTSYTNKISLPVRSWVSLGVGPLTVEAAVTTQDVFLSLGDEEPAITDGILLVESRHFESAITVWGYAREQASPTGREIWVTAESAGSPGTGGGGTLPNNGVVQLGAAIPPGTNVIGRLGIDQTVPGTSNAVSITGIMPLPAGAATEASLGTINTTLMSKLDTVNTSLGGMGTLLGSILGDLTNELAPGGGYIPSGKTTVAGTFTAAGQSAPFTPLAGRGFNLNGWGVAVVGVQLERLSNDGSTWLPMTAAGTQIYKWTAPFCESTQEDQVGVQYRLNCTSWTSGAFHYEISQ